MIHDKRQSEYRYKVGRKDWRQKVIEAQNWLYSK